MWHKPGRELWLGTTYNSYTVSVIHHASASNISPTTDGWLLVDNSMRYVQGIVCTYYTKHAIFGNHFYRVLILVYDRWPRGHCVTWPKMGGPVWILMLQLLIQNRPSFVLFVFEYQYSATYICHVASWFITLGILGGMCTF